MAEVRVDLYHGVQDLNLDNLVLLVFDISIASSRNIVCDSQVSDTYDILATKLEYRLRQ